jgi:hypothetical protein
MSPQCNWLSDIALLERKIRNAERFQKEFQKYLEHLQKLLQIAKRVSRENGAPTSRKKSRLTQKKTVLV